MIGCGKPAHNHGKNKPGTYCSDHQKIRSKIQKPLKCDNTKGFLGYECTTKIVDQVQIHIDHWDGNRNNNDPENIKYLCACCHAYKTALFRDHLNRYNGVKVVKKNDWTMLPQLHKERQGKKEEQESIFTSLFEMQ